MFRKVAELRGRATKVIKAPQRGGAVDIRSQSPFDEALRKFRIVQRRQLQGVQWRRGAEADASAGLAVLFKQQGAYCFRVGARQRLF